MQNTPPSPVCTNALPIQSTDAAPSLNEVGRGLATIQQHYILSVRFTWWGDVDPGIANRVHLHKDFHKKIFRKLAAPPDADGCYPTLTIRQVMWELRMKPIPKEWWETVFDRKPV